MISGFQFPNEFEFTEGQKDMAFEYIVQFADQLREESLMFTYGFIARAMNVHEEPDQIVMIRFTPADLDDYVDGFIYADTVLENY